MPVTRSRASNMKKNLLQNGTSQETKLCVVLVSPLKASRMKRNRRMLCDDEDENNTAVIKKQKLCESPEKKIIKLEDSKDEDHNTPEEDFSTPDEDCNSPEEDYSTPDEDCNTPEKKNMKFENGRDEDSNTPEKKNMKLEDNNTPEKKIIELKDSTSKENNNSTPEKKNMKLENGSDEESNTPEKKNMKLEDNNTPEKKIIELKDSTSKEYNNATPEKKNMKLENGKDEDYNPEDEDSSDEDDYDPQETNLRKRSNKSKKILATPLQPKENTMNAHAGLSPYELMIQKNIAEKRKFLDSLGIFKVKQDLESLAPVKTPRIIKPKPSGPVVLRRSVRQQQKRFSPASNGTTTPPSPNEINSYSLRTSYNPTRSYDDEENDTRRQPSGPAPIQEYMESRKSDMRDWETFEPELKKAVSGDVSKDSVWDDSLSRVLERMRKMEIREGLVVKAVPSRTFSIQIHPSVSKTLVLVGAKWGELGLWDVGQEDESNGIHYFNPHTRPINCLTVDPSKHSRVYTSSYDATLRTTDLEAGIVEELYSHVPKNINQWLSWHAHVDQNNLLLAASHGQVVQIDIREDKDKARHFCVHYGKNVKVITQHPTNKNYFATGSRDGNVCLWDVRNMKQNSALSSCSNGRMVCGLEFSPITGNSLISTSMDDYLKFISCDLTQLKVNRKIQHNNFTGRWLSNFHARFVPGREDLIVVGSMMHPRRVQIYGNDGILRHEFMGEQLGSVASVVAFHPTRAVLAGANSSGKVHVFM